METQSFQHLVLELEALTDEQRQAILVRLQFILAHATSQRLIEERLSTHPHCPYCQNKKIVRYGHVRGQQRYRCNACRHTFIALTKTPFQFLRDKDKLLAHAQCMADSLTIRKSGLQLQLSVDHAFRWRHRYLDFIAQQQPRQLNGVVEVDETFFPLSFKGQRKPLAKFDKTKQGKPRVRGSRPMVPVLIAMQRGTRLTHDCLLSERNTEQITAALRGTLGRDAVLSSDGNVSYQQAAKALEIEHGYFVASVSGHGGLHTWHVQNVNAYDSRLKRWMHRFHGVATKYLEHYLGWRRLLDRCKDAVTGEQFLFYALREEFINT